MRQCRRLPECLEVEKAISEELWTALAKDKERDQWSIDLGGEVEELEERQLHGSRGGDVSTSQTAKRLQFKKRKVRED